MKKVNLIVAMLLSIMVVFSLSACKDSGSSGGALPPENLPSCDNGHAATVEALKDLVQDWQTAETVASAGAPYTVLNAGDISGYIVAISSPLGFDWNDPLDPRNGTDVIKTFADSNTDKGGSIVDRGVNLYCRMISDNADPSLCWVYVYVLQNTSSITNCLATYNGLTTAGMAPAAGWEFRFNLTTIEDNPN